MKKILLSLCLLGISAPQATQASLHSISSSVSDVATRSIVQKAALILPVAVYFVYWKHRKPLPNVSGKWSFSNLISKFRFEWSFINEEIIGNRKREKQTLETSFNTETMKQLTIKDHIVTVTEYGLFGTIDAMIISKLKDIVEFIKNVKSFNKFLEDPACELGL